MPQRNLCAIAPCNYLFTVCHVAFSFHPENDWFPTCPSAGGGEEAASHTAGKAPACAPQSVAGFRQLQAGAVGAEALSKSSLCRHLQPCALPLRHKAPPAQAAQRGTQWSSRSAKPMTFYSLLLLSFCF